MHDLIKIQVSKGIYWIEAPDAGLYMLCGCPADSVKHLMKRGLMGIREKHGVTFETGPNAVLLSDVLVQSGDISNLAEFVVLQMLYRQGMILPNHPNNTGQKPLLVGSREQVKSQMEYIYRGNYGLISEQEMISAGIAPEQAREMMRMKVRFAFGQIRPSEDLLDAVIIGNGPVEIRNGVFIERLRLNIFEIRYGEQTVTVDLNLPPSVQYESPYPLGFHNFKRDYFGVIHSGDGDGWDSRRPAMASVLMFQGKIFLIDAGPSVSYSLRALGIGTSEIEGIFHTHAHDDHFAGLPTLIASDHKIKYFSTALVRSSVMKKLAALSGGDEEQFFSYFEVHDLEPGVWNDIEGLEVKPLFSPHPVETSIMLFRAMSPSGYKTYAHFADIIGLDALRSMIVEEEEKPGVTAEMYSAVSSNYLEAHDLKKIDVGGELIHGNALDFREDKSSKIILAHNSRELTLREKEIGSGAPFGMADVLIQSDQNYLHRNGFRFLSTYFPGVPAHQLKVLINNPILTFNPQSIILKAGILASSIYLIVSGEVEEINSESGMCNTLSTGALIGEIEALTGCPSKDTYAAAGFVQAIELPVALYRYFLERNGLQDATAHLYERRQFFQESWLLGEAISYPVQNRIAEAIEFYIVPPRQEIVIGNGHKLLMLKSGKIHLHLDDHIIETLRTGDFLREECILFNMPHVFRARTSDEALIYAIPAEILLQIPIVRWKLSETYRRRMEMLFNPTLVNASIFQWRDEYCTNVEEMDKTHRELFKMADELFQALQQGEEPRVFEEAFEFLISYAESHFKEEENLMLEHGFPECERHKRKHERFVDDVVAMEKAARQDGTLVSREFVNFLRDWIINHILTEDRKYGPYLNEKGIY